jgi:hypothetical protein
MMPSAGGVFLGVVKRRNSMITDAASPAPHASTKAELVSKLLVSALPADYAIALTVSPRRIGDIVAAALHLTHFEYKYLNESC